MRLAEFIQDQAWAFELLEKVQGIANAPSRAIKFTPSFLEVQASAMSELSNTLQGTVSLEHLMSTFFPGLVKLVPELQAEFVAIVQVLCEIPHDSSDQALSYHHPFLVRYFQIF